MESVMSLLKRVKKHTLVNTFRSLDSNSKAVVGTEPLWGIPFNLYIPFVSLYKATLGLSDTRIGLIASVVMFVSVISGLLSGAITDKLGRRLTTFLADLLSWSIPCLLWAFSQNFWWFMVAAAFNGLWQISNTSWHCLLVENVEKKHIVNVSQLIHLAGQLVVLFAPLSGLMVRNLTVVPAMRILYVFAFFSMTAKFIVMYRYAGETEQGKRRMAETSGVSFFSLLSGYTGVLKSILQSHDIVKVVLLSVFLSINTTAVSTFFGLYVTQNLGLPEEYLAYFPILRAVIMLFFYLVLTHRLDKASFKAPMLVGMVLSLASLGLLVLSFGMAGTPSVIFMIVLFIVLEAFGFAMVMPRRDSLMAIFVNPQERARMVCIINVLITVFAMPFGYISGWLSSMDRRLPFMLAITMVVAAFALVTSMKVDMHKDSESKLGDV